MSDVRSSGLPNNRIMSIPAHIFIGNQGGEKKSTLLLFYLLIHHAM